MAQLSSQDSCWWWWYAGAGGGGAECASTRPLLRRYQSGGGTVGPPSEYRERSSSPSLEPESPPSLVDERSICCCNQQEGERTSLAENAKNRPGPPPSVLCSFILWLALGLQLHPNHPTQSGRSPIDSFPRTPSLTQLAHLVLCTLDNSVSVLLLVFFLFLFVCHGFCELEAIFRSKLVGLIGAAIYWLDSFGNFGTLS